jgi:hypothetical protein
MSLTSFAADTGALSSFMWLASITTGFSLHSSSALVSHSTLSSSATKPSK